MPEIRKLAEMRDLRNKYTSVTDCFYDRVEYIWAAFDRAALDPMAELRRETRFILRHSRDINVFHVNWRLITFPMAN